MKNYLIYKADSINSRIEECAFATMNTGDGLFEWIDGDLRQIYNYIEFNASSEKQLLKVLNIKNKDKHIRYYKTERGAKNFAGMK